MAIITGTAVLSVGTGMKSSKLRDAARAVQLYTRHAKAVALLKQRPVVLLFEQVCENGAFVKSRVSISYSGDAGGSGGTGIGVGHNGSGASDGRTRTLSGLIVGADDMTDMDGMVVEPPPAAGEAADDPLMAQPREFEGIRIDARLREEEVQRPRVSVFSNVDVLLNKKKAEEARTREAERAARERDGFDDAAQDPEEKEASFSVVYEANGRCEPFQVTVYKDGADERDGLTVSIGRFGRTVTGD